MALRPASPFQAQSEISPGKTTDLHCTTAGSTSPCLGHESFAEFGPLALLGAAFYPVPVRRPAASLSASFTPTSRSGALRFTSLADQLTRGLPPPSQCPCRAHQKTPRRRRRGFRVAAPRPTSCRIGMASRRLRPVSRSLAKPRSQICRHAPQIRRALRRLYWPVERVFAAHDSW